MRLAWILALGFAFSFLGVSGKEPAVALRILLDTDKPELSYGQLEANSDFRFSVGLGAKGVAPAGSAFRPGYSLLGQFRVNAILARDRFEMEEDLVERSGKSRDWLRAHLFANMSKIDFDRDGKGGEYGSAYISLAPIDSKAEQPFHFGDYAGVLRWYSYAIHGTQDPSRIGKRITGGCINVREKDLDILLRTLCLGDVVEVRLVQP